ncbi:Ger(x)C family spore germination C-terminal domain-containing protein [Ammoniphilus sp. YIM 78166]|uniref:Ger(x)C family spore germination C-terminal domain-containing protein n=1 Tax=Ammoniphilus sp. YIM 78166 TaxID=1644106 RepID=UPI0010700873|nr:Ger(x)C family spore germination C-terminal domain-containing protein [Ammoniphilus sp. YIM 78166]
MVETLSQEEGKVLQALTTGSRLPDIKVTIQEEKEDKPVSLVLSFIRSKVKSKCSGGLKQPEFGISLTFTSELLEYTGKRDLSDPKQIEELEEKIDQVLRERVEQLIEKVQRLRIDPIHMGECVRKSHRGEWTKERWTESLAQAAFHVRVRNIIHSTGTLH